MVATPTLISGCIKKDRRTKHVVTRLIPGDIALIRHEDIDRVTAESLIATGVSCVINASASISCKYPNMGPKLLIEAGIALLDEVGDKVFDALNENDHVCIVNGKIYRLDAELAQDAQARSTLIESLGVCEQTGADLSEQDQAHVTLVGEGSFLERNQVELLMEEASAALSARLDGFTRNTLEYLKVEKDILLSDMWTPPTIVSMRGRHVLVVVRGSDYLKDLQSLRGYIREMSPVLIAVDGGADALLEEGFTPDIIVGDMDSVSDQALMCKAQLIVHTYLDGTGPGLDRLDKLGLHADPWALPGMSEDLALLLAYHGGADLIVAVGSHANIIEYLDKGRAGMSSTFLVRLKVGDKLVDAKGVSKLYHSVPGPKHLGLIMTSALAVLIAIFLISPQLQSAVKLAFLALQARLGWYV